LEKTLLSTYNKLEVVCYQEYVMPPKYVIRYDILYAKYTAQYQICQQYSKYLYNQQFLAVICHKFVISHVTLIL